MISRIILICAIVLLSGSIAYCGEPSKTAEKVSSASAKALSDSTSADRKITADTATSNQSTKIRIEKK